MPSLTFDIARRYLFGKKSTNAINIITGISIFGISIGTAALILILSVFNGFEGLLSGLFNAFNPDIKITAAEGKLFDCNKDLIKKISNIDGVEYVSKTVEEIAFFEYRGIQDYGMIKGVDDAYRKVSGLDTLFVDGEYATQEGNIHFGMLGLGMKNKLAININDKLSPITVYMPTKKKKLMGAKEFNSRNFYPAGVFSVKSDSDYQFILTSFELVSKLLEHEGKASALELKINPNANLSALKATLAKELGPAFTMKDRIEQDASTLKVMKIEKWIFFLITSMTMILVAFNLLGALWMIVLDKMKDISVLKALGLQDKEVRNLFIQLGLLITGLGILLGFTIAILIYYIQIQFGIVGMPSSFMMDSYPVQLKASDFLLVSITVFIIGGLASLLPAFKAVKNSAILRSK